MDLILLFILQTKITKINPQLICMIASTVDSMYNMPFFFKGKTQTIGITVHQV